MSNEHVNHQIIEASADVFYGYSTNPRQRTPETKEGLNSRPYFNNGWLASHDICIEIHLLRFESVFESVVGSVFKS